MIASTPQPPYYAVIFTSLRTGIDEGYAETAEALEALARTQPGFLGIEAAREGVGITVSYWTDLESIAAWKRKAEHLVAQRLGREKWYTQYRTRIALVERDYGFERREAETLTDARPRP